MVHHRDSSGTERTERRFLKRGDMRFAILEVLNEKPMHGYEIIKRMEEKTVGLYTPSPGSIYPTLQVLEDQNLVKVQMQSGTKQYHITESGQDDLEKQQEKNRSVFLPDIDPERIVNINQIQTEVTTLFRLMTTLMNQTLRHTNNEDTKEILNFIKKTKKDLATLMNKQ
ncbi:PadR family transcriptional regulator [Peribacillus loiseleuriae]|uniref:PadR family transcriptional regulator n=1 Tax=Peribacillus loiseleuriae TaxID=1679170 RepID=UPI003D05E7A8